MKKILKSGEVKVFTRFFYLFLKKSLVGTIYAYYICENINV